jgi:hypothetical protein
MSGWIRYTFLVLTDHSTLFLDQSAEVSEDLMQFMYARLNFTDLSLSLLNERLLVRKFLWRQRLL